MTVLVLYAVVPADAGQGPVPLDRLDVGPVSVLYAERDRPPSAERADLISFGEIVQDLASSGPVLPVRFGTTLPDLAGLRELAEEHGAAWRRRLDDLSGHVEMIVHARDPQRPVVTAAKSDGVSGTEYLLSRAAVHHHETELLRSLGDEIATLVTETRVLPGKQESRLACLVPAGGVDQLLAAIGRWAESVEGRQVDATGPWPPYSFTDAGEGA
jgi:hypothetical protein